MEHAAQPELAEQPTDMGCGGGLGQPQFGGDLGAGAAGTEPTMGEDALTGFLVRLEAAPSGQRVNVV